MIESEEYAEDIKHFGYPTAADRDSNPDPITPPRKGPPTCPACGAKFSHSIATARCNKCGLPDEVRNLGGRAIVRWKNAQRATGNPAIKAHGQNAAKRKRNKHGRNGVAICAEEVRGTISGYRKLSREKKHAAR